MVGRFESTGKTSIQSLIFHGTGCTMKDLCCVLFLVCSYICVYECLLQNHIAGVPSSRVTPGYPQYCASTCACFGCTRHASCVVHPGCTSLVTLARFHGGKICRFLLVNLRFFMLSRPPIGRQKWRQKKQKLPKNTKISRNEKFSTTTTENVCFERCFYSKSEENIPDIDIHTDRTLCDL